jgi:hypothetical protein
LRNELQATAAGSRQKIQTRHPQIICRMHG